MHRAALEGVVIVLAMRRRAVDEGGIEGGESAGVADHGRSACALGAVEHRRDITLPPGSDAKAGDVEHEPLGGLAHRLRRPRRARRRREPFGDRHVFLLNSDQSDQRVSAAAAASRVAATGSSTNTAWSPPEMTRLRR